ncbi:MAG: two-component sensor histidine kinase, partial [Desulfobacteraceae bacterium]|nr:two-component sensor histidine kinase [Desulfobacteraceae bacterium]
MIVATVSSLQYCTLVGLDYFGIVNVFSKTLHMTSAYSDNYIMFKIVIVVAACYAIAILSG